MALPTQRVAFERLFFRGFKRKNLRHGELSQDISKAIISACAIALVKGGRYSAPAKSLTIAAISTCTELIMQATKDTVVSFHYTLTDEAGNEVESSYDHEPNLFLFGHNNILPGMENAIEGKVAGDKFNVVLSPAEAFGIKQENSVQRVPAKYLKHEGKMQPGQTVRINTSEGTRVGTVVKVGKFNVDVDMNHPLADQTVNFAIEILEVRAASDEEIAHGHAHGIGGHHH
jgi:FKBP-type peptidyl-prolyl cis-trans isomerase SlyD